MPRDKNVFTAIYQKLFQRYKFQHWWPGETPFEIIVGAILTQNTNWKNVEKAIDNLKDADVLSPSKLNDLSTEKLAQLIQPSGFFNIKAVRLKNFLAFLFAQYGGSIKKMQKEPLETLRKKLLSVNGIGEETADSILLYALNKPIFVVDAYTKRVLYRHGLIDRKASYQHVQQIFERQLPKEESLFNEYHALIVRLAKEHCRVKPSCENCPINQIEYSLKNRCLNCHRTQEKESGLVEVCDFCAG